MYIEKMLKMYCSSSSLYHPYTINKNETIPSFRDYITFIIFFNFYTIINRDMALFTLS